MFSFVKIKIKKSQATQRFPQNLLKAWTLRWCIIMNSWC